LEHFDELVTVPDLKQENLREFDAGEAADRKPYQGKYHVVHSSGSTGKPGYFVYDEDAWRQMLLGIIRAALWGMSMPQILRLLMQRPRIVYIAATDGRYGGAMAVGDGTRGVGASQLYLDIKTPVTEWIRQLKAFRPNIVIGYPSAIKILAQLMENGEVSLDAERVISCGEPLGRSLRTYLENIFRTQVVNFYGASESLALGVETDLEEGMLLFDDMNIIEVEDLWFEDGRGNREFLHPLAIEGFCIEGLKDYQFRQTTKDTFEMYAETGNGVSREQIRQEMLLRMRKILAEKRLDYVQFYVNFVEEILPDIRTGKKTLILKGKVA
jgi:phenylacetate-CoA ligase